MIAAINETIHNASDLNELFEMLVNATDDDIENIDMANLPTFGSMSLSEFCETVCDTLYPVWSWDNTHAIIGSGEMCIVSHEYLRD